MKMNYKDTYDMFSLFPTMIVRCVHIASGEFGSEYVTYGGRSYIEYHPNYNERIMYKYFIH